MRDLAAIRASADIATGGPWTAYTSKHGDEVTVVGGPGEEHDIATVEPCLAHPGREGADGDFIAHARTDIPDLLDLVDALQTELARIGSVPELRRRADRG